MIVKLRQLLLDAIFEQEIAAMTLEMRAGGEVTVTGHLLWGSTHITDAHIYTARADTHTQTHSCVHTDKYTDTHTWIENTRPRVETFTHRHTHVRTDIHAHRFSQFCGDQGRETHVTVLQSMRTEQNASTVSVVNHHHP